MKYDDMYIYIYIYIYIFIVCAACQKTCWKHEHRSAACLPATCIVYKYIYIVKSVPQKVMHVRVHSCPVHKMIVKIDISVQIQKWTLLDKDFSISGGELGM